MEEWSWSSVKHIFYEVINCICLSQDRKEDGNIHYDFHYGEGKFLGQIKVISLCEGLFLKLVTYRPVLQQRTKSGNRKLFSGFT